MSCPTRTFTMCEQVQVQIFNHRRYNENLFCNFFPRLPKELRFLVWRHALCCERIITILLSDPDLEDPTTINDRLKSISWGAPKIVRSTRRYSVTIDGFEVFSKFLRICRESRQEALRFYRVQIPCRFAQQGEKITEDSYLIKAVLGGGIENVTTSGIFYFNPEWDFLKVSCWPRTTDLLPAFLHDLKTIFDPHGIGLLKLVISWGSNDSSLFDLDPSHVSSDIKTTMGQTLYQLHEVFFYHTTRAGRMNLGIVSGDISWGTWFNRSLPIATQIPSFNRFSPDPRPIARNGGTIVRSGRHVRKKRRLKAKHI
jgi:hypothetical protein